ncbi:hypothetical protein FHS29_001066 [Saccharothrix tamanrassetensis]|uniref:Uncharacterized protein n=1 Tax=Saccharothrix tamanrassetensis TaxID=1051531 RepID=A0A841CFL4_9PSEU|nr:hypothetical protein [Saccharothrix tamanrassetensis]MBB5954496.1 hypothetical protein [Saccharothrix tamanrassetensis]
MGERLTHVPDDHERLVADALRAQATSSGSFATPASRPTRPALGAGWVLLLAVLLGSAAGTVAAVITLR